MKFTPAQRTLQAIKQVMGAHLREPNEIEVRVFSAYGNPVDRLALFDANEEHHGGAIAGNVFYVDRDRRHIKGTTNFKINADGTIDTFPGLFLDVRVAVEKLIRDPTFCPTMEAREDASNPFGPVAR